MKIIIKVKKEFREILDPQGYLELLDKLSTHPDLLVHKGLQVLFNHSISHYDTYLYDSIVGPQGAQGPPGPRGQPGPEGPKGSSG